MTDEQAVPVATGAPSATRHDLQLGRRLFHLLNGVTVATAYALLFTHQQVVHIFGAVACLIYIADRVRIAYPEAVTRYAPIVNRTLVRAEEQMREAAMTPYAIAVLLTILTMPKAAALIAIYTLAIADPLAAICGIRFGKRRITQNRSLEGSLAFFLAATVIAAAVFTWNGGATPLSISQAALLVGLIAALGEIVPLRIDDNLTIPIFVGFISWLVAACFGLPL